MGSELVSICVVTYNSSKYVTETLDSIFRQTYKNIELIISDDCSKDDTNETVDNWISNHKARFQACLHIVSDTNTGLSNNCNRALSRSRGKWVKMIAGDDALLVDCIQTNMFYAERNSNAFFFHSKARIYKDELIPSKEIEYNYNEYNVLRDNEASINRKYKYLFLANPVFAASVFLNREMLERTGGYDESIRNCEDLPTWIKMLSKNVNMYFISEYTVQYRLHSESINSQNVASNLFPVYFELDDLLYDKYLRNNHDFFLKFSVRYYYYLRKLFLFMHLEKQTKTTRFIFRIMNIPYYIAKIIVNRKGN